MNLPRRNEKMRLKPIDHKVDETTISDPESEKKEITILNIGKNTIFVIHDL